MKRRLTPYACRKIYKGRNPYISCLKNTKEFRSDLLSEKPSNRFNLKFADKYDISESSIRNIAKVFRSQLKLYKVDVNAFVYFDRNKNYTHNEIQYRNIEIEKVSSNFQYDDYVSLKNEVDIDTYLDNFLKDKYIEHKEVYVDDMVAIINYKEIIYLIGYELDGVYYIYGDC